MCCGITKKDETLLRLKRCLVKAQEVMKSQANKHRRDVTLQEGELVYLKLRPYRQQSVVTRFCQKLAAKFYGSYKIVDVGTEIRTVDLRLN